MSDHSFDPKHDHVVEHVHGFDSFVDRYWQAFVIAFGVVFVSILAQYNPTAN